MKRPNPFTVFLAVAAAAAVWSGIQPKDRGIWLFELVLGFLGIAILIATYRRFRFSGLAYFLMGLHFIILAIGARYTYGEVPFFNWLKEQLGLSRNHFDRVGHFAQGFVPAIIVREILARRSPLERGKWLGLLSVCVCLAFSAFYEILEWWMVICFYPDSGPEWLGLQGDPWDPHWDMTLALGGASLSLFLLSRFHDRSIQAVSDDEENH
jgi:putative membrane protein